MKAFLKIGALLLIVFMLFSVASCNNVAGNSEVEGDLAYYDLGDGTYAVGVADRSRTSVTSVQIPATFHEKPVREIARNGFTGCTALTEVTVPSGIEKIGRSAFSDCSALTSVALSEGIQTVEAYAFTSCVALTSVKLPASVTKLGSHAFAFCSSLTQIDLSVGIEVLEEYTFYQCVAIKNIVIPDGISGVEEHAFDGCAALLEIAIGKDAATFPTSVVKDCKFLRSISVDEDNTVFASHDGILYDKLTYELLLIPSDLGGEITIAEKATKISASAFAGRERLTKITLPENMITIGACAFVDCTALEEIVLTNCKYWKANKDAISEINLADPRIALEYFTVVHKNDTWICEK